MQDIETRPKRIRYVYIFNTYVENVFKTHTFSRHMTKDPIMYIDPDGHRALKEGSKGSDVKTLQKELQEAGYKIAADGVFGPKTEAALKDYQRENGLAADGIAGVKTKASMGLPTDKSTSSIPVKLNPAPSYCTGINTSLRPGTSVASAQSAQAAPQGSQPGTQNKSTTEVGKNVKPQESNNKMTWPTESTNITSDFGYRNNPKKTKEKTANVEFHAGIDIGAVTRGISGDEVYAAADGTVVTVVPKNKGKGGGNIITIETTINDEKIKTKYMHLKDNSINVIKGDKIEEGDVIANMGSTGRSTNPHLHFQVEVYNEETKKWVPVDPEIYLK